MSVRPFAWLLLLFLVVAGQGSAAEPEMGDKKDAKEPELRERLVKTEHVVTIDGKKVMYTATAGTMMLKDEEGKSRAGIFFVAYTKDSDNPNRRPITFTFNGGPGSSSVWLHLGAFGPRRVELSDNGDAPPPPYKLVNNDASLLDVTDLVFIDPVMTGFSRPAPGQDPKQFLGVQQDVESVGDFIRLYITRFKRWDSPRFLAGESYGTTRAAGLSGYLQDRHGINLNGIILVSSVLNFGTIRFDEGNDLPYALFLPTYTAVAWYHKKLPPDLQKHDLKSALTESEKFAQGEYAQFLMKGSRASEAEVASARRNLARLTGLSEDYIARTNYRVDISRFDKELLRDKRRTVGRYDGRYQGTDIDAAGERPEYDPSYAAVQGAFTSTLNRYVRNELNYESDIPYEILTGRVQPWDYGAAGRNRFVNVSPTLRGAMTKNPDLRLFVASGYYDLATPYLATDYTLAHLGLENGLAEHVTVAYYEAGHMMYVHRPSHEKLRKDLVRFYRTATPE
jgi:carboxypeptidase C (cathepsin A)